jgi:hypothetical protein
MKSAPAYVVTYHPLCSTPQGRRVRSDPPFADGSCRREPDLESAHPSITALCRGRNFAPRLRRGDRVAYVTCASRGKWRLTALLEIIERCETHEEAAQWYRSRKVPLPSNCMIPENPPLPLERTIGKCGCSRVEQWDEEYQQRAREHPVFLISKPVWRELHHPPVITRADWSAWGGAPTRNPKNTPHLWEPLWRATSRSSPA